MDKSQFKAMLKESLKEMFEDNEIQIIQKSESYGGDFFYHSIDIIIDGTVVHSLSLD